MVLELSQLLLRFSFQGIKNSVRLRHLISSTSVKCLSCQFGVCPLLFSEFHQRWTFSLRIHLQYNIEELRGLVKVAGIYP